MRYALTTLALLAWSAVVLSHTERWAALTKELTDAQRGANVPAMGLVIMDSNRPVVVSAWGDGVDHRTPFRWGSISKTFTALALLRLVEQGRVELDEPASRYLPAGTYRNPWAATQPLRLLHLLELTGGFADLSRIEFEQKKPLDLAAALALNPQARVSHWPPGLQHSYTNVNPGLTAAVIERLSGQLFEDFVHAEVLTAMDMQAASFHPVPGLPGGFMADGVTEIPYWHMSFRAYGALNASLEEMARFLATLLGNGKLGERRVFAAHTLVGLYRQRSGLVGKAGLPVGYGTGAYGRVSHGHVFYGHGGDADGYRSRYGLLPAARRGYLIVINTDNRDLIKRLEKSIERALTADLPPPAAPAPVPQPAATLQALTGQYYPASARFGIERWQAGNAPRATVRLDDGQLVFSRRGRDVALVPLGNGRFRRATDPVATVIFARDPAGALFLQGELGNFVNLNSEQCPGFIPVCDSQ